MHSRKGEAVHHEYRQGISDVAAIRNEGDPKSTPVGNNYTFSRGCSASSVIYIDGKLASNISSKIGLARWRLNENKKAQKNERLYDLPRRPSQTHKWQKSVAICLVCLQAGRRITSSYKARGHAFEIQAFEALVRTGIVSVIKNVTCQCEYCSVQRVFVCVSDDGPVR